MGESASRLLQRLEALVREFGPGVGDLKLVLLRGLEHRRLARADAVHRLHEALCFLRAYPDDARVLEQVERMLESFAERGDLQRFRTALADTGIAGTGINYRFFWPTALRLVQSDPSCLAIDWAAWDHQEALVGLLSLLLPYSESPALDELELSAREWLERVKGPQESDAEFLVRRVRALDVSEAGREKLYDALDVPLQMQPGSTTPARGREKIRRAAVTYQITPLSRARPDLRREVKRPPLGVRTLDRRVSLELLMIARDAMVTRSRDLDGFAWGNPADCRLFDCGDGLQFAAFGLVPERRLLLEASYAFLTLKNGVPIGYVLASALFGSAAIAYNVFDTFRSGEAARIYGRVLATACDLFGLDTFTIDPYQLGHGNEEGLLSGAWWFYYKLGFRPHDREIRAIAASELERMAEHPGHRSSRKILEHLAAGDMFLYLGRRRQDVLGRLSLGAVGMAISRYLAARFGADREKGLKACAAEAAELLELDSLRDLSRFERLAWQRWAPLVLALPEVQSWAAADRRELASVIRSKGGRHESDFVRRFDDHRLLRQAVASLARQGA